MAEATETNTDATLAGAKTGIVTSAKSARTIHVMIERVVKHPRYGKYLRRRTRLAVDDPKREAKVGDVVEIVPCRRLSKTKSWRLTRIVRAGGERAAAMAENRG